LVVKPEDLAAGTGRLIDFITGDRSDVKLTASSVFDAL